MLHRLSSPKIEMLGRYFEYLLVAIVAIWLSGLRSTDIARIVLLLSVLGYGVSRFSTAYYSLSSVPLRFSYAWFGWCWLVLLALCQLATYVLAKQGFDFAIFSQAIASVADRGSLATSFIWTGWVDFLTHHFSPILYIPGTFVWLGLTGPQAAILFQIICVGLAILLFYKFARALGFRPSTSSFLVMLLCLNPTFRVGTFWEVRDEIFALPFLGWAYYSWLRAKDWQAVAAVALACTCKENMFIFAIFFGIACLLLPRQGTVRRAWPYIACVIIGVLGIVAYFYLFDFFFVRTFDPHGRISRIDEFLNPVILRGKLILLTILLLPFFFLPLAGRRALLLSLPSMAFIGPILVSNMPQMYHTFNYYGVVPTYIFALASLYAISLYWPKFKDGVPVLTALIAVSLSLSWAGFSRPGKLILQALRQPWYSGTDLQSLPKDAPILADDYSFPFLLDKSRAIRFWTAERTNPDWEFIVQRRDDATPLNQRFLNESEVCREHPNWIIRCRKK